MLPPATLIDERCGRCGRRSPFRVESRCKMRGVRALADRLARVANIRPGRVLEPFSATLTWYAWLEAMRAPKP